MVTPTKKGQRKRGEMKKDYMIKMRGLKRGRGKKEKKVKESREEGVYVLYCCCKVGEESMMMINIKREREREDGTVGEAVWRQRKRGSDTPIHPLPCFGLCTD